MVAQVNHLILRSQLLKQNNQMTNSRDKEDKEVPRQKGNRILHQGVEIESIIQVKV